MTNSLRPRRTSELICPTGKSLRLSLRWLSSPSAKNISLSPSGKSNLRLAPSRPSGGALAIVTDAGRDAVDACGARDESAARGRRSRVVLTPRRWRQVGGGNSADDGGKRARSPGRARRKPLKPLRGECRVKPV